MASPYDNIPTKIFIGGISPVTSQETIQKYFSQFGDLCDCVLMQDKATGKSRGFGFVTYRDPNSVDNVLSTTHSIDGKEVDCKRAIPRDQQGEIPKEDTPSKTRKLFVGGLPQNITEDQFRGYFEQFGTIEDSVIMVDKDTGKSRGFGFVTFDSEEAVDRVMQRYYENKIEGKWVECKRAQPKDTNAAPTKKFGSKPSKGKGQGFYQDESNPQKSSQSYYNQDTYGESPYMQNAPRDPAAFGQNPNYYQRYPDYNQNPYGQGFGGGYQMNYPMDPNYGNYYPGFYNNPYGAPQNQYMQGQYGHMGYGNEAAGFNQMGGYGRSGMPPSPGGNNYYGRMNPQASNESRGKDGMDSSKDMVHKTNDAHNQSQSYSQPSQSLSQTSEDEKSGLGPSKAGLSKQSAIEGRYYTPY